MKQCIVNLPKLVRTLTNTSHNGKIIGLVSSHNYKSGIKQGTDVGRLFSNNRIDAIAIVKNNNGTIKQFEINFSKHIQFPFCSQTCRMFY